MACILLIDDDTAFRTTVREILDAAGYKVIEASNHREGIAGCQTHPIDLVLTDLLMPQPDGFATMRAVRVVRPTVKIIAMSGGGETGRTDVLHMAAFLGADRVLQKPMRRQALLEAVQAVLEAC